MTCSSCSTEVSGNFSFCPSCGGALDRPSALVTEDRPPSVSSTDSDSGEGRFRPGEVLADRYRIVNRVGKGGMGEVYRADDLELQQPVALKFLPEALQEDPERLSRFRREVRLARQVSHPNVCRVYDIGEARGEHFLSMEYIDGEDLGSLLRRIGRLPQDKAVEIARQICLGLAAAHDRSVLHRDLKPANVMIDGRGQARLTDFGLAALAGEVEVGEARSGTPAFMSPEQWAGRGLTVQSALYSLGLVLYELFTGKHAFDAKTPEELQRLHRESTPRRPSSLVEGLDPAVEKVILRCLQHEPPKRPGTAMAVAAALPGGDPLAEALAAGETPSPQLVAEARGEFTGLRPAVAWALLVSFLVGTLLVVWMSPKSQWSQMVPLPKTPDALAVRAQEVIAGVGYPDRPRDRTYGFSFNKAYVDYLAKDSSATKWEPLGTARQGAIRFWYRQSPRSLVPHRITEVFATSFDPPALVSGMVAVELDPEGRLRRFEAVPPELDDLGLAEEEPDWQPLFAEAGLDLERFEPTEPIWNPPTFADRQAAWEGAHPDDQEETIRVEAAADRGKPVAFRVVESWTQPDRMGAASESPWGRPSDVARADLGSLVHLTLNLLLILGAALLARRNLHSRRGDRKGAFRLASYFFALNMLHWLFGAHHVLGRSEVDLLFGALYVAFFHFGLVWILYIAVEPYARRLWPRMMISWMRLLDGLFRDPLVGRDVLMGCIMAAMFAFLVSLSAVVPVWLGHGPPRPDWGLAVEKELAPLGGIAHSVSTLFLVHSDTLKTALFFSVALLLLRFLLRRKWLAVGAFWLLWVLVFQSQGGIVLVDLLLTSALAALFLFFLFRFGWLSIAVGLFVNDVLLACPLTFDPTAWYAGNTLFALVVVFGLAIYGFKVSLGDRPAFEDLLAEG